MSCGVRNGKCVFIFYFRPVDKNKAVITLSAAAVQAEFEIGEGTVTLVKFASGNKPPVKGIQDRPMTLAELTKEMRRQGVDIFPDHDSHCYIEGLPLKASTCNFNSMIYLRGYYLSVINVIFLSLL